MKAHFDFTYYLFEEPKKRRARFDLISLDWRSRMKSVSVVVLLLLAVAPRQAAAAPLTATERQHLVAHLQMTESWLADEISGLSSAQIQFRTAPGRWTILEVMDHLTVAEPLYWQLFHETMKEPRPSFKGRDTDADILWYGIDRSQPGKAIPGEEPKGELRDVGAGLALLRKLHAEILQYVGTTDDDLRGHLVFRQDCDAYQWLLMISTHEQRHVLQIREVKADPKFPRSGAQAGN
jgi:hypothetical protein